MNEIVASFCVILLGHRDILSSGQVRVDSSEERLGVKKEEKWLIKV